MNMRKPEKTASSKASTDAAAIEKIIGRGGSVAQSDSDNEPLIRNVQLRTEVSILDRIDTVRSRKPKNIRPSRHSWMIEAILDKLDREEQKTNGVAE